MRTLLAHPALLWLVLFAYLCTVVAASPPKGWRAWVTAACWLVSLCLVLLRVVLR